MSTEPYHLPHIIRFSELLVTSYRRWTGWELVSGRDLAYGLFFAPFPVTSQGLQDDPLIQYANLAALEAWETTWDTFIGTPSRLSAPADPATQEVRSKALGDAAAKGWTMNYSGERISQAGNRFQILNTVVWNVTDEAGMAFGQAARIGATRPL